MGSGARQRMNYCWRIRFSRLGQSQINTQHGAHSRIRQQYLGVDLPMLEYR